MADEDWNERRVRRANLFLLSLVYWVGALLLVGLVLVMSGDCFGGMEAEIRSCVSAGRRTRNTGLVLVAVGYPLLLWFSAYRRQRRRNRQAREGDSSRRGIDSDRR